MRSALAGLTLALGGGGFWAFNALLGSTFAAAQSDDLGPLGGDDEFGDEPGAFDEDEMEETGMPDMGGMPDLGGMPPAMETSADVEDEAALKLKLETMPFTAPTLPAKALFWETFQTASETRWIPAAAVDIYKGQFQFVEREKPTVLGDIGMKLSSAAAFHGAAAKMDKAMNTMQGKNGLFGSMEVQYETPVNCGGAYFKLFHTKDTSKELANFEAKTPYSIMFGPDKCGISTNKVHFIIRYENPASPGNWIEAHLKNPVKVETGTQAHQYAFAIYPEDDTYEVYVDSKVTKSGKMVDDFEPAFKNAKEIRDPNETKPADWVDEPKMADPLAHKPDDWDETVAEYIDDMEAVMPEGWLEDAPLMIPNLGAVKPEDWDDAEDGEWVAPKMKNPDCFVGCGPWKRPLKKNPDYKGKWTAPMIDNPDYKGVWQPALIPNPDHYDIGHPAQAIAPFDAVGFEIWTVESGAMVDNLIITHDKEEFLRFVKETFGVKSELEAKNADIQKSIEKAKTAKKPVGAEKMGTRSLQEIAVKYLTNYRTIGTLALVVGLGMLILRRSTSKTPATTAPVATTTAASSTESTAAAKEKTTKKDATNTVTTETSADDEAAVKEGMRKRKTSTQDTTVAPAAAAAK